MYMSIGLGTLKSFLGGVGGYTAGRLRASIADHIPTPKTTATNATSATTATTATNYASPVLLIPKTTATTVISVINVINYASPVLHFATARMLLYILIVSSPKIHQAPMCRVSRTNKL